MEISQIKNRFKIAPVPISYIDRETGEEKTDVLQIKYRPLTREWYIQAEQVEKQIEQIKKDCLTRLQVLGDVIKKQAEAKAALDKAGNHKEKVVCQKRFDEQSHVVEKEQALLESFIEESKKTSNNALANQLLPILIDLDIVDNGVRVEPSLEVLNSLDFEFLLDVLETIKKKTYREKAI